MTPAVSAGEAGDEGGHGFVGGAGLHLVVVAGFGFAFAAGVDAGHGDFFGFEFGSISSAFALDGVGPVCGVPFLVCHGGDLLRGPFAGVEVLEPFGAYGDVG